MFTVYGIYPDPPGHEDGHTDLPTLVEALACVRDLLDREAADPDGPIFDRYGLAFDRADAPAVARQVNGIALLKAALADQDLELSLPEVCWSALDELREVLDALPDLPEEGH